MILTKEQEVTMKKIYGSDTVEQIKTAENFNSLNIPKNDLYEVSGMELKNELDEIPHIQLQEAVTRREDPAIEMLEYSIHERDRQFLRSLDYARSADKIRAEVIEYCRENGVDYKAMTALAEDYREQYINSEEYERREEEKGREEEEREEENNPWLPGFGQYY